MEEEIKNKILTRSKIMKKEIYVGTKFLIELIEGEKLIFILAECHEEGYFFQLICIEGYNAGKIYGLIEEQKEAIDNNLLAIDLNFLKLQLVKNVFNYDINKDIKLI